MSTDFVDSTAAVVLLVDLRRLESAACEPGEVGGIPNFTAFFRNFILPIHCRGHPRLESTAKFFDLSLHRIVYLLIPVWHLRVENRDSTIDTTNWGLDRLLRIRQMKPDFGLIGRRAADDRRTR